MRSQTGRLLPRLFVLGVVLIGIGAGGPSTAWGMAASAAVGTPIGPGFGAGTVPGVQAQIIINQPGHYFLENNLNVPAEHYGIYINSGRVTLDLGGLTITGQPNSSFGIYVADLNSKPRPGIMIENGTISGMGLAGIFAYNTIGSTIRDVQVVGGSNDGIRLGQGLIENCHARGVKGVGISTYGGSIIRGCTATKCSTGFSSSFANIILSIGMILPAPVVTGQNTVYEACVASDNTHNGFIVGQASTLSNCSAHGHGYTGFSLGYGSRAVHCVSDANGVGYFLGTSASLTDSSAIANTTCGVSIGGRGASVEGNTIDQSSGGTGIEVLAGTGPFNIDPTRGVKIANNTISFAIPGQPPPNAWAGIRVKTEQNLIIGNVVLGSQTPYDLVPGNSFGPVLVLGGGLNAANSPLCNFRN
jgi:Right handed beta helix region